MRHRPGSRTIIAWTIAVISIAAFVIASLVDPDADGSAFLWAPVVVLFVTIGALLWTKVPANPIGPLFLTAGGLLALSVVVGTYATLSLSQPSPWPGTDIARKLNGALFFYPLIIAVVGVPLIFPDGRLPSARFRWAVVIAIVDLFSWTMNDLFSWPLNEVVLFSTIVGLAAAVAAVTIRFRRGDPVQRQQVKWLAADAVLAAILLFVALVFFQDPGTSTLPTLAMAIWILAILALVALPISIAVAILRYGLYEIDRLISRTITYTLVIGVLAAIFAGSIVVLTAVLPFTDGQTVPVAASTLAAFALFQPVMRRVRRVVDRRFDRARYDAERTAAAFSDRLRGEVDMETVTGDLIRTAAATLSPTRSGIWLRGPR